MIARLHLIARLLTFAAASWILAVIFWAVATGAKGMTPPLLVVRIFIGGAITQLLLWVTAKVARRT
ncbi:MAG: hypothetical protein ACJ8FT_07565 [Sphingomonas sp.]